MGGHIKPESGGRIQRHLHICLQMETVTYKTLKNFSIRRVSTDQAIKTLKANGIDLNEEEARVILDFLYLIAKSYSNQANQKGSTESNREENSNLLSTLQFL